MGSYHFKWTHPANEVYVTGTFDDWGKTVKLEKVGDSFEKTVDLPNVDDRVYYKFVVDDNWTFDHTAPQETDAASNTNNVLMPEHIQKKAASAASGTESAAAVDNGSSDLPGAFPETPAAEEFRAAPIPASAGIGNPIHTKPGDPIPPSSSFTSQGISDNVTLDKESYENSGKASAPQLPNPITPPEEREANGGMFGLPNKQQNIIPESSLPMGSLQSKPAAQPAEEFELTTRSAAPESTTAQMAGQVPLEPKAAPEVVKDSQAAASADAEASANPKAVQNKAAVENELTEKIPEQPATAESTVSGKAAGSAAGVAASATAAAAGAAAYVSSTSTAQDAKSKLPVPAQETIDKLANGAPNGSTKEATPIASTVPDAVQESIAEAHQTPEAAANVEAVQEKAQVESELLKKVKPEDGVGEPAPTVTAANTATAPVPLKSTEEPLSESKPVASDAAAEKDMTAAAAATTATAASPADNAASSAPTASATAPSPSTNQGLAAPASAPAKTAVTEEATPQRIDSRDVSPMSHPVQQPMVTSGVASASTPQKSQPADASSSTPAPSSPISSKTGEGSALADKKSKRRSFFGRIKDKFEHKKDKN